MSRSASWLMILVIAGCGVRTPAAIDIAELLARRGPVEARRDLEIRVIEDPRDVQARLALAAIAETLNRPSQAIEQLDAVVGLGGPIGIRWHTSDRARLARLLVARGQDRLKREAPTALADLARATQLGASVTTDDLGLARLVSAMADLRHVDAKVRERGRRALAPLTDQAIPEEARRGSLPNAALADRAEYAMWLWAGGMKRAGWDALEAWHAAAPAPRALPVQTAYLQALAWWSPIWTGEAPPPPASDLVGPERCRFGACRARDAGGDRDAERAFLAAQGPRITDPIDAAAFAAIALRRSLSEGTGWGALLAAHVDLDALVGDPQHPFAAVPKYARALYARLVGRVLPLPSDAELATADEHFVVAAVRLLVGATPAQVRATLGDSDDGSLLLQRLGDGDPQPAVADASGDDPIASAAGEYVRHQVHASSQHAVRDVLAAYRRDPVIADRIGRDLVAESIDAAVGHATLGALFDALGDPARARTQWQAAVDVSPEPRFQANLAEAIGRAGDGDAALIAATAAAAASGDPAIVWLAVATALDGVGQYVHALEAARSALDLAGPEQLAGALEVSITASRALGRTAQADALAARRAAVAPRLDVPHGDDDPTDTATAIATFGRFPTATSLARLWVASRWTWRDVAVRTTLYTALAPDDPRRIAIRDELVELARWEPITARAAIAALRAAQ